MSATSLDLEIYVEEGCRTCRRSLELADHVRRRFPDIDVRIIDGLGSGGRHEDLVFATPTFILNGGRVSLGNPSIAQLEAAIVAAMKDLAI